MYIIVGLGNPEKKYDGTRHNIGFTAIELLASRHGISLKKSKHKALFGDGMIEGQKVLLVQPQTYMNLSGEAVRELCAFYKVPTEQVVVLFDDISLPLGKIRVRPKGSDGGHNGIKSIIYQLGSDAFPRVKIGVSAPPHADYDLADYVLGKFSPDEIKILTPVMKNVCGAVETILSSGVADAMNRFNGAGAGE
ncbi:MAG: aminoacyl-tRNA hydrolase [Ruminococcaceae bacterium]|nr:aminoacyl-tRNA hydrolase [Oscillospiraceae bacterium]